ncbi:MAG TPA: DUF3857 and transglutaminase domain-containing protein [Terracidiphilus sp.]|nr:DUF3857 and transglutaminase domain-containing protein [Terracidiphilus sp.]
MRRLLSPLLRSGLHRGSAALAGLVLAAFCTPVPAQTPASAPAQAPAATQPASPAGQPKPTLPSAASAAAAAKPTTKPASKPAPESGTKPATSKPATDKPAASKPHDFSQEALVFDQLKTRIRMEADGTGTRETTARIRIQADAGVKAMAVLTFTYTASDEAVDIGYVRVIKPDGTIVVTPPYNVQDLPADVTRSAPMYSDIHQKHVAVRGLGVGDTLEYQSTLHILKPEVPGQFWDEYTFEKNLIILDEELDLDVPAGKPVTVTSTGVQPAITTANGRKLYHWVSSNLKRPDPEHPTSTKHWKPSVQVTTFTSWQQIGAWYQSLQQQAVTVTPAIQARVDTLTRGLATPEEKLRAIFRDVSMNIHYVGLEFGIGRYQPHNADDVLANEYGDCKDKHTLLATMLKAAGITAWPVLINSSRELDPDTPSPAQFDHVITIVPLDGKLLWMDSTEEVAPIGTLAGTLRDKQALAIPPDKPAYLIRTPADLPYQQSFDFTVTGKLSDQGQFTGHFVQSYHGDVGNLLRLIFRATPQSQWKQLVQRYSNATGFGGVVDTPTVSPIEKIAQPFELTYDYTRDKYGEWDQHRVSPPFPSTGWETAPGAHNIKPADDIDIGSPGASDYRATMQLPTGWTMYPRKGVDLVQDWAEYHSTYTFKDGAYTAERRLIIKKDKVPLADWDKYLAFRNAIYDDENWMTGLVPPGGSMAFGGRMPDPALLAIWRGFVQDLQPSTDARKILAADPAPPKADVAHAVDLATKGVRAVEARTATIDTGDAHSLQFAQILATSWCIRGWAALDAQDLPTAGTYLRAAWQLSPDRVTGYLLGQLLVALGKKKQAAHQFELASVAPQHNLFGGPAFNGFDPGPRIAGAYRDLTGHELSATAYNHGAYDGSLQAELDSMEQIRPLVHSTRLTGSALFILAFQLDKPMQIIFLDGDPPFHVLEGPLRAHHFAQQLPSGSKARLLREVRVICSPWAGCDAYLLAPTEIAYRGSSKPIRAIPLPLPTMQKGAKVVEIPAQPQPK